MAFSVSGHIIAEVQANTAAKQNAMHAQAQTQQPASKLRTAGLYNAVAATHCMIIKIASIPTTCAILQCLRAGRWDPTRPPITFKPMSLDKCLLQSSPGHLL